MDKKIRYTLGKNERLKSRKAIEQLFKDGKSMSVFPLRVLYVSSESHSAPACIRAGFTVSSRNFKKAVERNRIKRLMREAWRLQKHQLQLPAPEGTSLSVFLIYTGKEMPLYQLMYEKMNVVIKRFIKLISENH